jgi:hypothetical protein
VITRRTCLQAIAACVAAPLCGQARTATPPLRLAAAWDDDAGRHHIGVLKLESDTPSRMAVEHALEVPSRAHAVLPCTGGDLVAVARRPGAWIVRWRPGRPASSARWQWSEPDRSFNGHVVHDGAGVLVCTEADAASGAGLLVRRDAHRLHVLDERPIHGIDPHAVLRLPEGGWLVANGGVPTQPESGRTKRNLAAMDSSLAQLDARGELKGTWRLPDRRLSLRHLALHADGTVGVAMQAEHDDPSSRSHAPLLALWDGHVLRTAEAAPLEGYAGDIVARPGGFVVAATRAGVAVQYDLQGHIVAQHSVTEACALAPAGTTGWLAAGRQAVLQRLTEATQTARVAHALRIDNHWCLLRDA